MSSSTTLLNHLLPTDLFLPTTLLLPSKSPFLSLPSKPLSLSLKKKQVHLQNLVPLLVAQTSDWAQQEEEEEESQVNEGEDVEEELEFEGEGEGEDGGILAEGEDAFVEGENAEDVGAEEEEVEEEGYPEPPEDAKLFVGNLPYEVDSQRLAELFEKAGVVEVAENCLEASSKNQEQRTKESK